MAENISPEMAELVKELQKAVDWLQACWLMQRQVFTPENTDTLRHSAGLFFAWCNDALGDDIQMSICRLTDPPRTMGQENLTFKALAEMVEASQHEALKSPMRVTMGELEDAVTPFRRHRNKRTSHNDLETWKGRTPLPLRSSQDADRSIELMRNVLNGVRSHFESVWHMSATVNGDDGARLMVQLRKAKEVDKRAEALPPRREVPLAMLDTPANRRYMRALQNAYEAGKEVDAERYGPHEDGPAAGGVELLMAGVELEVLGPAGARE